MSVMGNYDVDEFDELMQQSRSGGRETRNIRLCRSLPSSPLTSPHQSPEDEDSAENHEDFETQEANPETDEEAENGCDPAYANLLCPPDPFQEVQVQQDCAGASGGARPKLARMSSSPSKESVISEPVTHAIRRTQSCRRPTTIKRHDQNQFSYRQRAHANAWRQHANQTSTDEELETTPPGSTGSLPTKPTSNDENNDHVPEEIEEPVEGCKIYRVRSFRTTNSGIVNKGDSFKIKSRRQSSKQYRSRVPGRRMSTDTTASRTSLSREDLSREYPDTQRSVPENGITPESTEHQCPAALPLQDVSATNCLSPYDAVPQYGEGSQAPVPPGWDRHRAGSMDRGIPPGFMFEGVIRIDEDSAEGVEEEEEEEDAKPLKVIVLGMHGVGKRTLTRQLLTSEYLANTDRYQADDDQENVKIVSVMLDDEESVVQFIDARSFQEAKAMDDLDAYVVVYSVTDRNSFAYAHACLQDLTKKGASSRRKVIIVVANKQDCVRSRVVSEQEGRSLASHRNCKYTEVSALLDHKIDELLVGTLRQIRLNQANVQRANSRSKTGTDRDPENNRHKLGCLQKAALGIFRRLFRKRSRSSGRNRDNLLL